MIWRTPHSIPWQNWIESPHPTGQYQIHFQFHLSIIRDKIIECRLQTAGDLFVKHEHRLKRIRIRDLSKWMYRHRKFRTLTIQVNHPLETSNPIDQTNRGSIHSKWSDEIHQIPQQLTIYRQSAKHAGGVGQTATRFSRKCHRSGAQDMMERFECGIIPQRTDIDRCPNHSEETQTRFRQTRGWRTVQLEFEEKFLEQLMTVDTLTAG